MPALSRRQRSMIPELYINRELSLLDFQRRVLEEAQDSRNPLLERLMFLSFVGSNIDEFFMVRVAGLKRQVEKGVIETGPDGMTPAEQLRAIRASVIRLFRSAHDCWTKELVPALEAGGIHILNYADLRTSSAPPRTRTFRKPFSPRLTPLAFDPGRPFPHISNLSLNLAVLLRAGEGEQHFARVKIPDTLPQLVPVTSAPKAKSRAKTVIKDQSFVWLEQLVTANLEALFPGMKILEAHPFHVTRDADSEIQDLEAGDLLESVEEGVWQRRFADVVRVEIDEAMPATVLDILIKNLELDREDIYKISGGPLSLVRVRTLTKLDRPDLKFPAFVPALPAALHERRRRRGHLHRHPARRHPAASSLRFLSAGSGAAAEGSARSQCAGYQDHALSRGTQRTGGRCAAGGGGKRQAGRGAAGAESALRRREQHRLGAQAGRIRRTCGVWAGGIEGALQGRC